MVDRYYDAERWRYADDSRYRGEPRWAEHEYGRRYGEGRSGGYEPGYAERGWADREYARRYGARRHNRDDYRDHDERRGASERDYGRYGESGRIFGDERGWGEREDDRGSWGRGRGYADRDDERGFIDRASDEVRSWFGNEEAQRRRMMDEREGGWSTSERGDYGGPWNREQLARRNQPGSTWWGGYNEPAAGPYGGRGPRGWQRSDERIKDDVCERMTQHPYLDASDIDVQVGACEVTLLGAVPDRRAKRLAEEIAEAVSGVREVHNQIRQPAGPATAVAALWRAANRVESIEGAFRGPLFVTARVLSVRILRTAP